MRRPYNSDSGDQAMGPTANPNTTRLVARVMTSVETWNSLEVTTVAVEKTLLAKVIHMVRDDIVIVISHLRQTGMLRGSSGSSGPSQPTRLDSRSPGSARVGGCSCCVFRGGPRRPSPGLGPRQPPPGPCWVPKGFGRCFLGTTWSRDGHLRSAEAWEKSNQRRLAHGGC